MIALQHDFLGCSVTTIMSHLGDLTVLHLAPSPSADDAWPPAGAMQCVFIGRANNRGYEVRPIAVGTEGDQISHMTLRAFDAAANTGTSHRAF